MKQLWERAFCSRRIVGDVLCELTCPGKLSVGEEFTRTREARGRKNRLTAEEHRAVRVAYARGYRARQKVKRAA